MLNCSPSRSTYGCAGFRFRMQPTHQARKSVVVQSRVDGARSTIVDRLANAARVGYYDRQPGRHGFDADNAERLERGSVGEGVAGPQNLWDVSPHPEKSD
jgi:hypothetical protein